MTERVKERLGQIADIIVEYNASMAAYTTFRVGGRADAIVFPQTVESVGQVRALLKEENVPCTVLGAGSNVLVKDGGIRGAVICLRRLDSLTVSGNTVTAGSGVSLVRAARAAQEAGLGGLEFASGIPGLCGGAVYMNAGAYGGEMKDVVQQVTYLDEAGNVCRACGETLEFSYRKSMFSNRDAVILEVVFSLSPKNKEEIGAYMRELSRKRREKQPTDLPSAGSTFKRPAGYFAAKLIDDAGLRGARVGGACVSEKHTGFVVNDRNATAKDILKLMEHVQTTVENKFGVRLVPEVRILGED